MFKDIQLSEKEAVIAEKFIGSNNGMKWVRNVINRTELSEEENEFSSFVEGLIRKVDKHGLRNAKDELSMIALTIIENDDAEYPYYILDQAFDRASYGEFDTVITRGRIKNTLHVYETAARTGNVDADYVDFSEGSIQRTHLQAEIIYKMENLRKAGAVGFAEFVAMIQEQFEIAKFKAVFNMMLNLKTNPDATGAITSTLLEDLTDAIRANCKEGMPVVAGLSTKVAKLAREYRKSFGADWDEATKSEMVRTGTLKVMDGIGFAEVRDALKTADGETVLPANKLIGIAGKIG